MRATQVTGFALSTIRELIFGDDSLINWVARTRRAMTHWESYLLAASFRH